MVRFPLGRCQATPGALSALEENENSFSVYLTRHQSGDWGELSEDDRLRNESALETGERLLSAYRLPDAQKIWVITEADRSLTTILLPDEY